jgi:hypothetical protein
VASEPVRSSLDSEEYKVIVIVQLIFLVMLLGVAWVWLKQFVWMMSLGDDSFAGRYDKLIWGLAFVFLFPIAPFAFILWKGTAVELRKG